MEAEIRTLAPADAEAYLALRLEALERDPRAFTSTYAEEAAAGLTLARRRLENPAALTFAAFAAGAMVGTVTLIKHEHSRARHKCELVAMYVSGPERGQGIGARLVDHLLDFARREPHLKKVMLQVVDAMTRRSGSMKITASPPTESKPRRPVSTTTISMKS